MIIPHNDLPFSTFYLYLYTCFAENLPLQCNHFFFTDNNTLTHFLYFGLPVLSSVCRTFYAFNSSVSKYLSAKIHLLQLLCIRLTVQGCDTACNSGWIFKSVIRPLRSTLATASTTFIRPLHSPFIETQINPVSLYKDEDRKLYSWGNNLHSTVPFNK